MLLSNWKLIYFAFEQQATLNNWVTCMNVLRLQKRGFMKYFIGIDARLQTENILGITYTKFASQVEYDPTCGSSLTYNFR